ncbi:hypothetical protein DY218_21970 [Streptomyces triticagri]|uniref:Uncharacterized protein n=1 Tax=Streptomyces triticagri TaxID=2293568 RepID=A0A372M0S9_9ACTN|nr:DUF6227 family protein [Streptomyces triticagri]RFU84522.1 hypothetical protein DY218_21970 [Streptomyces triticagri]
MSVTYETPEEYLKRLLGRALNSFELPDETISSLDSALAYDSSLHAAHHTAGLHRETRRHTFLLADGRALTLWELAYGTTQGGPTDHELYTESAQADLAASRLAPDLAGDSQADRGARTGTAPRGDQHPDRAPGDPGAAGLSLELELGVGAGLELDFDEAGTPPHAIARLRLVHPDVRDWPARTYSPDDSADHARRLLRRAENADRPRDHVAEQLRTALAHQITQSFGHPCGSATSGLGCALYEHAFLLTDGNELSLWELEHTATPDGRHMCEVYEDEQTARTAMDARATTHR